MFLSPMLQHSPAQQTSTLKLSLLLMGTECLLRRHFKLFFVDTNLTFFREVLGFDDAEIQQETQNAFQFFNERFGLDFSRSEPNELGIRFFQNATFQPNRQPGCNLQPLAPNWKHSVQMLYCNCRWIFSQLYWRADIERNIWWRRNPGH